MSRVQLGAPESNHGGQDHKPISVQGMAWHTSEVFKGHEVPWKASWPEWLGELGLRLNFSLNSVSHLRQIW